MSDDDDIYSWAESPGALDFLRDLKLKRKAQLDSLVGAAGISQDPVIRMNWGALSQLDIIIKAMEDERGKSD